MKTIVAKKTLLDKKTPLAEKTSVVEDVHTTLLCTLTIP
jgi:hypothetical protein